MTHSCLPPANPLLDLDLPDPGHWALHAAAGLSPVPGHCRLTHCRWLTSVPLWSRHQPVIITFRVLILCKRSIYKYNLECAPFFSSSSLISFKWDMRLTFLPPGCFISRALSICCVLLLSIQRPCTFTQGEILLMLLNSTLHTSYGQYLYIFRTAFVQR